MNGPQKGRGYLSSKLNFAPGGRLIIMIVSS